MTETPGERYVRKVANFKGVDFDEQVKVTLAAQKEFNERWELNRLAVAENKKRNQ